VTGQGERGLVTGQGERGLAVGQGQRLLTVGWGQLIPLRPPWRMQAGSGASLAAARQRHLAKDRGELKPGRLPRCWPMGSTTRPWAATRSIRRGSSERTVENWQKLLPDAGKGTLSVVTAAAMALHVDPGVRTKILLVNLL